MPMRRSTSRARVSVSLFAFCEDQAAGVHDLRLGQLEQMVEVQNADDLVLIVDNAVQLRRVSGNWRNAPIRDDFADMRNRPCIGLLFQLKGDVFVACPFLMLMEI